MNSTKMTRRALFTSVVAIFVCITMLIGTTFAWFTDTASTAVNKIQAGTLKVDIVKEDGVTSIKNESMSFVNKDGSADILWEPGATFMTPAFKIKSTGSLALKYKLTLNGITGDNTLLDVITFSVVKADGTEVALDTFVGHLTPDAALSDALYIKGHMDEAAGNDYQDKTLEGLGITVYAAQDTVENDSNGNTYDTGAEYAIPVATADELAAALANGRDVILTAPVQMPDVIEIKNDVTIYGGENGQLLVPNNADRVINITDNTEPVTLTLSNVDVVGPTTGAYTRGVSVYGNTNVTIVADNSSVSANYYALNIAKDNDNVQATIRNTTLTGWCAFQTWSAGTKATFENCTLIGNNDKTYNADGWNNFATVVINENTTGVELTFNNCRIEANQTTGNKQYLMSVRASDAKVTMDGCTFFANGTEIADEDLGNYLNIYSVASDLTLTIDGSVIPIE